MGVDENLIGLWRLNKGSGVIAFDTSGNGNNGALEGTTPTWVDGKSGKAVNLPGVNERIDCGNSAPLDQIGNGSFWISFWMKSKDTVPLSFGMLFSKYEDVANRIELASSGTSNRFYLVFRESNLGVATALGIATQPFDTIWNHIVLEINRISDKAIIYMNTVKDATEIDISSVPADASNAGDITWGSRNNAAAPYEGGLDEMRINTGVPTQKKIDFLYNYPDGTVVLRRRRM